MTADSTPKFISRNPVDRHPEGALPAGLGTFASMQNCPPMIVARAAIHGVRDHPYAAIGIAIGVVLLIGRLAPPRQDLVV